MFVAPLFATVAILATGTYASPAEKVVVPVEQRLELELDPAARMWSGSLLATLHVNGGARSFALELRGPVPSRVEMTDAAGRVPVTWGVRDDSVLVIEVDRDLAPGRGALNVAFDAPWRDADPGGANAPERGLRRDAARHRARLHGGAGTVFPAWPRGTAPTPWTLLVHAPRRFTVSASGRRTDVDDSRGWRTWWFSTARPLPADSLRVTVRRAGAGR